MSHDDRAQVYEKSCIINNVVSHLFQLFTAPTSKKISREKSQFLQPRSQDLVQFRKEIEAGNLAQVHKIIWSNPRYLVSAGDTPAILKEGPRYNALHVASLSKNAKMIHLLLQTIAKKEFIQFLHGTTAEETSQVRYCVIN
jgi:ankyrin repeat and LEM domain-containing protein 2